ncbi:MAG: hypothetical protein R2741_11855 [Methanolobus sp.]
MGSPVDRTAFIASLLYELEQQYIKFKTKQFTDIIDEWINLSDTIGKEVKVTTPNKIIEGRAVGITEKEHLLSLTGTKTNRKSLQEVAGIKNKLVN